MVRKKPVSYLDPKTGLLKRKTTVFVRRRGGKVVRPPSRVWNAISDLFDLKFRKK
jgi:hypothetical protein